MVKFKHFQYVVPEVSKTCDFPAHPGRMAGNMSGRYSPPKKDTASYGVLEICCIFLFNLPSRPVSQKALPGCFCKTLRSRQSHRLRPAAASSLRTRKTRNAYQAPARPLLPIRSGSGPILQNPSTSEDLIKISSSLRWKRKAGSDPLSDTCWNGRFLSSILPEDCTSCRLPESWKSSFAPIHWIRSHLKNSASPA